MGALYTAKATATGGRQGGVRTDDGRLDVQLAPPPEIGGPADGDATNPEQLFAAGYGACFLSALQFAARSRKISAKAFTIDATVDLLGEDDGSLALAVRLDAHMPGVDRETAQKLIGLAHRGCPYSKATRGNIEVALLVDGEPVEPPQAPAA